MGRPKGGKNRRWTVSEKLRIVNKVLEGNQSLLGIADYENISRGMLSRWVSNYQTSGRAGLENKKKNPLAKYARRKELSEFEELQYENMKLKIEVERLKKGYEVRGGGKDKEYATLNNLNSKSLKN